MHLHCSYTSGHLIPTSVIGVLEINLSTFYKATKTPFQSYPVDQ